MYIVPRSRLFSICRPHRNLSYKSIVKEVGIKIDHKRIIASDGRVIDNVYHIQHVNGFIAHFKEWLDRFKGVGTSYLGNYLAWYIWMKDKSYGQECLWIEESLS